MGRGQARDGNLVIDQKGMNNNKWEGLVPGTIGVPSVQDLATSLA